MERAWVDSPSERSLGGSLVKDGKQQRLNVPTRSARLSEAARVFLAPLLLLLAAAFRSVDAPATTGGISGTPAPVPAAAPEPMCPAGVPAPEAALAAVDLVRDNLDADFSAWRDGFTMADVLGEADRLGERSTRFLVEIRGGRIVLPRHRNQTWQVECHAVGRNLFSFLEAGLASGALRLPDVTFVLNVYDYGVCSRTPGSRNFCKAPVFSLIKNSLTDHDILVPPFQPAKAVLRAEPWESKSDLAFFRGTPYCGYHRIGDKLAACSRAKLANITLARPDVLNSTIVNDAKFHRVKAVRGPKATHAEHAGYKYLLNLDGHTASYRLGMLMGINSLVLKQDSPWIEYYYRSLKPCVHYVPFYTRDEEDVVDVVLAARASQARAQSVAACAQAFAATHFTDEARYGYWEAAVARYLALLRPG